MSKTCLFTAILSASLLAACGGGGDAAQPDPGAASQTGGQTGAGPTNDGASCPGGAQSDVWMDQRLGCLTAGAQFTNLSAGYATAGAALADRAMVLNQAAFDLGFGSLTGSNKRYFQYFLCMRNAPAPAGGASGFPTGIGADMLAALKLASWNKLPAGIGTTTIGASGGGHPGWIDTPCDPAKHPVIVNYATGRIESVNPAALPNVTQYLAQ